MEFVIILLEDLKNVILVGKDEKAMKSVACQFPNQATVAVANITDDY